MPPSCALLSDLQSVHGLRCYGNITRTLVISLHIYDDILRTRNVSECSVLAVCLVLLLYVRFPNKMSARFHTTIVCVFECQETCGLRIRYIPSNKPIIMSHDQFVKA